MTRFLLALIAFYRRWISPALHAVSTSRCKFIPTCSEYAAVAIATHGPLRGCRLAAWRLVRCHPFTPGGFDPVPIPRPVAPASRPGSRSGGATGLRRWGGRPAVAWASRPTHEPSCVSPASTARLEPDDSGASQVPLPREPLP